MVPSKMLVIVGALALTTTTLLAGCGGSSSEATDAAETAAVQAPATAWEGTVKPADVSDENWAAGVDSSNEKASQYLAGLTPEDLSAACEAGGASAEKIASEAEEASMALGGSIEEWKQVFELAGRNLSLMACSMTE